MGWLNSSLLTRRLVTCYLFKLGYFLHRRGLVAVLHGQPQGSGWLFLDVIGVDDCDDCWFEEFANPYLSIFSKDLQYVERNSRTTSRHVWPNRDRELPTSFCFVLTTSHDIPTMCQRYKFCWLKFSDDHLMIFVFWWQQKQTFILKPHFQDKLRWRHGSIYPGVLDLKGEKVAQLPARDVTLMSTFDVFVGSTIDWWLCLADARSLLSFGIFHFNNTFPWRSLPAPTWRFRRFFSCRLF